MICSPKQGSRDTDVQVVQLLRRDPLHVNIIQVRTVRAALREAGTFRRAEGPVWIERARWSETALLVAQVPGRLSLLQEHDG